MSFDFLASRLQALENFIAASSSVQAQAHALCLERLAAAEGEIAALKNALANLLAHPAQEAELAVPLAEPAWERIPNCQSIKGGSERRNGHTQHFTSLDLALDFARANGYNLVMHSNTGRQAQYYFKKLNPSKINVQSKEGVTYDSWVLRV